MPNLGEALSGGERTAVQWYRKTGIRGVPIAGWEHRSRHSGCSHWSFGYLGACFLFRDQPVDIELAQTTRWTESISLTSHILLLILKVASRMPELETRLKHRI